MPYRATGPPDNWLARSALQLFQAPDIPYGSVVSEEDCVKQQVEVIARSFGLLFGVSGEELERSERRLLKLRLCKRDAVINLAQHCINIHSNVLQEVLKIICAFFDMYQQAIQDESHERETWHRRHSENSNNILDTLLKHSRDAEERSRVYAHHVADNLSAKIWIGMIFQFQDADIRHAQLTLQIENAANRTIQFAEGFHVQLGVKIDDLETKVKVMIEYSDEMIVERIATLDNRVEESSDTLNKTIQVLGNNLAANIYTLDQNLGAMINASDNKVDAFEKKVDKRFDSMDQKADAVEKYMDKRFDAMDQKVKALDQNMDKRFNAMDQKVDALEKKVDKKFDAMDQRVKALDQNMDKRFNAMDQKVDALEKKVDKKFDAMDQRVKALDQNMDKRFNAMDQKVDALEKKVDKKFDAIDQRFDAMGAMLSEILARLPALSAHPP